MQFIMKFLVLVQALVLLTVGSNQQPQQSFKAPDGIAKDVEIYQSIATSFLKMADYSMCAEYLHKAIDAYEKDDANRYRKHLGALYANLAEVEYLNKQYDASIAAYQKTLNCFSVDPQDSDILYEWFAGYYSVMSCYALMGDTSRQNEMYVLFLQQLTDICTNKQYVALRRGIDLSQIWAECRDGESPTLTETATLLFDLMCSAYQELRTDDLLKQPTLFFREAEGL